MKIIVVNVNTSKSMTDVIAKAAGRENIHLTTYEQTGIGIAKSDGGKVYYYQIFAIHEQ